MSTKIFLSQQENTALGNFIQRASQSPELELEARWWNKRAPLRQDDFLQLLNTLKSNDKFKMKKEFTRKIIYNNNFFQLKTKNEKTNKFSLDPRFFIKLRKNTDVINTQYGFRIMLSREATISKEEFERNKAVSAPFFRDRDRTSFVLGLYSFDLTISREGATEKEVEDEKTLITYEVEIEYMGNQEGKSVKPEDIYTSFLQNLGYVISIIQDSPVVIGENEQTEIIKEYNDNFLNRNLPEGKRGYLYSPLTKPIDIEHRTMAVLQEGYSVTEKADGIRMVAFVSGIGPGIVYFIQHIGTRIKVRKSQMVAGNLKGTVLDGEFVKMPNGTFIYLIIDILWFNGQDTKNLRLLDRLTAIQQNVVPNVNPKIFIQKAFHFQGNIHALAKQVLESKFPYETDGLIFTPLNAPYDRKVKNIYKWKPSSQLTIDFFTIRNIENPNEWKLFMNTKNNQPQLFIHPKFPNAGTITVSDNMNKKFRDVSVIEYSFDTSTGKWSPNKSRPDKVAGNFVSIVEAVFSLILNPVTKSQITGQKQFYEPIETTREARQQASNIGFRNFHNWVKARLITQESKRNDSLADFGSGKGGDIHKWNRIGLSVEGFDIVPENVAVANERLAQGKGKFKNIRFHQADLSKDSVQKILMRSLGTKKDFDVITSFFGIHYFFDSKKSNNTFFKNVAQSLKTGGTLVITTFDGKKVHKLLEGTSDKSKTFKTDKFEIRKEYDENKPFSALPIYGNKIVVKILETELRSGIAEYLVKPSNLQKNAKSYGLKLEKSGLFSELYKIYKDEKKSNMIDLSDSEKQLSFLNRYYVFTKVSGNSLVEQEKMMK